jgi:hypothetical protein
MSWVHSADDTRLGRPVAVKLLAPGTAGERDRRVRFQREAHLAARIHHPNVVSIYDAGEEQDELYLVMERLPGLTLAGEMAAGPMAPERVRVLALELLAGLGAAHESGVLHRDVKPSNVLFTADGSAKLADFGIATFTEAGDLTQTAIVLGTLRYLAPERLQGAPATAAGDIYALGVVLREAVTGSVPGAPGFRSDLDPELDRVIDRAFRFDPAERFVSAAAMAEELSGVAPSVGALTAPFLAVATPGAESATETTMPQPVRDGATAPLPVASLPARRTGVGVLRPAVVAAFLLVLIATTASLALARRSATPAAPPTSTTSAPTTTGPPPTTAIRPAPRPSVTTTPPPVTTTPSPATTLPSGRRHGRKG